MIVVDTNILACFWLPSEHAVLCERVYQKDSEWIAPLLWRSEFRSVLSLYLRKELLDLGKSLHIIEKVEAQFRGCEFSVQSAQVLDLVLKSRCSAYDCEFVALAEDLGVPLVTLDKKILGEFPQVAVSPEHFLNDNLP